MPVIPRPPSRGRRRRSRRWPSGGRPRRARRGRRRARPGRRHELLAGQRERRAQLHDGSTRRCGPRGHRRARRARSCGRGWWRSAPSRAAREVDQLAGGEGGVRRSRASSSISPQVASVIGACSRSRWLMTAPPSGSRYPATRCRPAAPAVRGALDRRLLGLLAVLDDVALREQDALGDLRHSGVLRSRNSRSMQKCLNSSPCASRMIAAASGPARPRGAARTSRSPPPPRSATRRGGRTSASRAGARPAARGTGRSPCRASSRTPAPEVSTPCQTRVIASTIASRVTPGVSIHHRTSAAMALLSSSASGSSSTVGQRRRAERADGARASTARAQRVDVEAERLDLGSAAGVAEQHRSTRRRASRRSPSHTSTDRAQPLLERPGAGDRAPRSSRGRRDGGRGAPGTARSCRRSGGRGPGLVTPAAAATSSSRVPS